MFSSLLFTVLIVDLIAAAIFIMMQNCICETFLTLLILFTAVYSCSQYIHVISNALQAIGIKHLINNSKVASNFEFLLVYISELLFQLQSTTVFSAHKPDFMLHLGT